MTLLLGALLAAGVVLSASPWLWPAGAGPVRLPRAGVPTRLLREAGFRADVRVFALVVLSGGLVSGAVAWLMTGAVAFVLVLSVAGAAAPVVFLRSRRQRLLRMRRGLWPDVCDLLIASIRVGMPLPDAVAALERAAPGPLRPAFAAFARDLHGTGRFDDAAAKLKDALADPVGDRIIETLRMAREVGGTELSTVLRALSGSVRAEAALRAEVEARQSWIRGAAVLGAIAPWVILVLLLLRPEGSRAYATPEGIALILGGAVVSFVAFRIMLRIGRLPEQRRWFR
ncbi:type II secretion system F family protein [Microbacterium sp.]|uniref:type II secretion system F family protein n=1 Tax=Microbacterium sp. TaxID=51671 RepID=UPI001AC98D07|nr:type II secretion system F family protein [Microbacterium sp.]MBN9159274.1 type II secretion system F family protein [Microbacterium sp.]MBS1900152.1 type II secretion system F family protein [Actinomycetota bacterium]